MRTPGISICLLIGLVAIGAPAYPDEVRLKDAFLSHDGAYRLSPNTQSDCDRYRRWEMIETSTGNSLYSVCFPLASRSVVIGPEGTTFFAFDDQLPNALYPDVDFPVAYFFKSGVLTRQYSLGRLIGDSLCGSSSTSLFYWLADEPRIGAQGVTVQLSTRSLYSHVLSLSSGVVLRSHPSPIIKQPADLLFGTVQKAHRGTWTLDVTCTCMGSKLQGETVPFSYSQNARQTSLDANRASPMQEGTHHTVLVAGGKYVAHAKGLINRCKSESRPNKPVNLPAGPSRPWQPGMR